MKMTIGQAMFQAMQYHTLSRKTDPATSKEAARNLVKSGAHKTQCDKVYAVLKRFKKNGANANEIAARTGMLPHVVLKRLPDLMKKGVAFKTHVVRENQTVWKAGDC